MFHSRLLISLFFMEVCSLSQVSVICYLFVDRLDVHHILSMFIDVQVILLDFQCSSLVVFGFPWCLVDISLIFIEYSGGHVLFHASALKGDV